MQILPKMCLAPSPLNTCTQIIKGDFLEGIPGIHLLRQLHASVNSALAEKQKEERELRVLRRLTASVLKPEHASKSPGRWIKTQIADLTPRVSDLVGGTHF